MFNKKNNEVVINKEKEDVLDKIKLEEEVRKNNYLNQRNKDLEREINKIKENLQSEIQKNIESDVLVKQASANKELTEMQLKDIKIILEQYRQLPDLKNMIDNLSSLTTPSLDKLINVIQKTDFKEILQLSDRINSMESKMQELINIFSSRRMY